MTHDAGYFSCSLLHAFAFCKPCRTASHRTMPHKHVHTYRTKEDKMNCWFKNKHFTRFSSLLVLIDWMLFSLDCAPPSNFKQIKFLWINLQFSHRPERFVWGDVEFDAMKSNFFLKREQIERIKKIEKKTSDMIWIVFPLDSYHRKPFLWT